MAQRRWLTRWLGGVIGFGLLILGITQASAAGLKPAQGVGARCSVATLHGTYQFSADGFLVGGPSPGPLAYAGLITFDGKGAWTATLSISLNGSVSRLSPDTGTYTVNSDCSGTHTETGGAVHYDYFIRPDGSRYTFIETDPGSVTEGTSVRETGPTGGD